MFWLDFASFALGANLLIFVATAGVVWYAGSRISRYADGIARRTGLGEAFIGLLLLALATEMPEIGTTVAAGAAGNASLAVGNLFGGVIMQTAILAVVDLVIGRGALTYFSPRPVLLLQGVLLAALLGLTLAATTAGELFTLFGVGLWSILLFVAYMGSLYLSHRYEGHERWQPDIPVEEMLHNHSASRPDEPRAAYREWSLTRLGLFFAGGSLLILIAGVTLAQVGEALATQVGLSQTFVGATLLAAATSLPELSTSITAARLGNYSMAVANIFGSNAIMVALILLADLFYRAGPILETAESAAMFTVAIGVVATCIYVAGLIERRNQVVLRMGIDSIAVLFLYAGSLVVLYFLA